MTDGAEGGMHGTSRQHDIEVLTLEGPNEADMSVTWAAVAAKVAALDRPESVKAGPEKGNKKCKNHFRNRDEDEDEDKGESSSEDEDDSEEDEDEDEDEKADLKGNGKKRRAGKRGTENKRLRLSAPSKALTSSADGINQFHSSSNPLVDAAIDVLVAEDAAEFSDNENAAIVDGFAKQLDRASAYTRLQKLRPTRRAYLRRILKSNLQQEDG
ncbi:hypothetical protein CF327_g5274 [Tilletia walkeri]|nr:hypothetical protein CF327_g5274 [Tilletia walkeri]